jgi:hypothetical protein
MPEPKKKPSFLILPFPGDDHKQYAALLYTDLNVLQHIVWTCSTDNLSRIGPIQLKAMRTVINLQLELWEIHSKKEPEAKQPQDGEPEDT